MKQCNCSNWGTAGTLNPPCGRKIQEMLKGLTRQQTITLQKRTRMKKECTQCSSCRSVGRWRVWSRIRCKSSTAVVLFVTSCSPQLLSCSSSGASTYYEQEVHEPLGYSISASKQRSWVEILTCAIFLLISWISLARMFGGTHRFLRAQRVAHGWSPNLAGTYTWREEWINNY